MKRYLNLTIAKATTIIVLANTPLANAEEVFFDTVSTAKASRSQGAYFGIFGGGAYPSDADYRGRLGGLGLDLDGDSGWLVGAELGYTWDTATPLRPGIEVEFMYLGDNSLDANGTGTNSFAADINIYTLMFNGILALDLDQHRDDVGDFIAALHPYVGAGLGWAYSRQRGGTLTTPTGTSSFPRNSDNSFAWQFFAGLEVDLTERVSVYGEYKYLVLDKAAGDNISDYKLDLWTMGVKVEY
ncbi:MAG: outer membrane beta-barrel protein [Verrucomicrobiota bacterium]